MQHLIEAIKRQAAQVANTQAQPRWGIVESVDPARPAVRVSLQPEGVLTGWLPVLQQAAGGGMTVLTVPEVGWQACVIADLGHADHGIVVGFSHSDSAVLPDVQASNGTGGTQSAVAVPLAPGETAMTGLGGTVIRFGAGGALYLRPGSGTLQLDGHLAVNGNIVGEGDISDRAGAHGTLAAFRTQYDEHTHTVQHVQGGGATVVTDITGSQV